MSEGVDNEVKNLHSSTDEIDEKRLESVAYQYLCHLEEARLWIQTCVKEELPLSREFENCLRNGVYLAKLSNFFVPNVVPLKKIFDVDQNYYNIRGLHFRHTDNINYWFQAMQAVGLPNFFYPETFDVYEKKNMPKVIYCIHALSLYLFRLGKAPQIRDLYGKLKFTSEEIELVNNEFKKYGIEMPSFGKIGGILAHEMQVNDATLHAAIIAINKAIDKRNDEELLAALNNPNAHLRSIIMDYIQEYKKGLYEAKMSKAEKTDCSNLDNNFVPDVYDELLTRDEILCQICHINTKCHLNAVVNAVSLQDEKQLIKTLIQLDMELADIIPENSNWYLKSFGNIINQGLDVFDKSLFQNLIRKANIASSEENEMSCALFQVNDSVCKNDYALTLHALKSPVLGLYSVIIDFAAELYHWGLSDLRKKNGRDLTLSDIQDEVKNFTAVAEISKSLETGQSTTILNALRNPFASINNLELSNVNRYFASLTKVLMKKLTSANSECSFLTQNEIQETINEVNNFVKEENYIMETIELLRSYVNRRNAEKTLETLTNLQLPVVKKNAELYTSVLGEELDQGSPKWTIQQLQSKIKTANSVSDETHNKCLVVFDINKAVETKNTSDIMSNLKILHSETKILEECFTNYAKALLKAKEDQLAFLKDNSYGNNDELCFDYFGSKNCCYFLNIRTLEGCWKRPESFPSYSSYLSKQEINVVVNKSNEQYKYFFLCSSQELLISRFQARIRGHQFRSSNNLIKYLKNKSKIIKLQQKWKLCVHRKHLEKQSKMIFAVIKIQSFVRMWIVRKRYRERKHFFKDNENLVKTIQAFWRAYRVRQNFQRLINSSDLPVYVIQQFVHYLTFTDQDYTEELHLQKLKEKVVETIRRNQELEKEVNTMDVKIGLLVQNHISVQECISQKGKLQLSKHKMSFKENSLINGNKGLMTLSRKNRNRLELYQQLFYMLQTNPNYLARLIFAMPHGRSTKFVESVILSLFNYGSTVREEYLLICLLRTALKEEIKTKVQNLSDIITGNPLIVQLIISFHRIGNGQKCLEHLLEPLVNNVIENSTIHINTNIVDIYKLWINEIESAQGKQAGYPYEVTSEEAIQYEDVKERLNSSIESLKEKTKFFCDAITSSVNDLPYGLLYLSKVLKCSLTEKFPSASENDILKVVGNLIYYRYINPAIAAPDVFGIVKTKWGESLSNKQRRNLGSIAKVLQFAAVGKNYDDQFSHMICLNPLLDEFFNAFLTFFKKACDVSDPEDFFDVNTYSEAAFLGQPTIYLTAQELKDTHKLLKDHEDKVTTDGTDLLHEILESLGKTPEIHELVGASEDTPISFISNTEIVLSLTNKFPIFKENFNTDIDFLYVKTKLMVTILLHSSLPKNSLVELLNSNPTLEENTSFLDNQNHMNQIDSASRSVIEKYPSLAALQNSVNLNLKSLELAGYVTRKNCYQDILNAIAKDIINRHHYRLGRIHELKKLREAQKQLDIKTKFFEEKLNCYNEYVKICLKNLSCRTKRSPNTLLGIFKDFGKSLKFKSTLKYTATKLQERGILVEIKDVDPSEMKHVNFEIMAAEEGTFLIRVKFLCKDIEEIKIDIQKLLQLQYEGSAIMDISTNTCVAKININLLLYLLNSKFYS